MRSGSSTTWRSGCSSLPWLGDEPAGLRPAGRSSRSATRRSRRRAWESTSRATTAFALSAALTGIAGALYAHKLVFVSPEQFGILLSIEPR